MATPPPELPAGTPWWVGAGIAVVSTIGGIVLAALGLLARRPPDRGPIVPVPRTDGAPPPPPPAAPSSAAEVLAVAERQWAGERDRYDRRIDELEDAVRQREDDLRALRVQVDRLEAEVQWQRDMIERLAPRQQQGP